MYRLLEPEIDSVLETDEFFNIEYLHLGEPVWKTCAGDPNCGHRYTKFMFPIRRIVPYEFATMISQHDNEKNPCIECNIQFDCSKLKKPCPKKIAYLEKQKHE